MQALTFVANVVPGMKISDHLIGELILFSDAKNAVADEAVVRSLPFPEESPRLSFQLCDDFEEVLILGFAELVRKNEGHRLTSLSRDDYTSILVRRFLWREHHLVLPAIMYSKNFSGVFGAKSDKEKDDVVKDLNSALVKLGSWFPGDVSNCVVALKSAYLLEEKRELQSISLHLAMRLDKLMTVKVVTFIL